VSARLRVARLAVAGAVALSVGACTCPDPITLDQVFLLDATPGDGGLADAGAPSDGGASPAATLDCTATAAACVPGGPCRPACDCVLARDRVNQVALDSCTLVAGAPTPEVEVRYRQRVFCGGD